MAVPSRSVGVQDFLEGSREKGALLLDARSPGEFAEAHIPGAVSFPLFDDAERAEVGTMYKQEGREMAVERGLEFIGPRMADMVRSAKALFAEQPDRRPIHMYCWRGQRTHYFRNMYTASPEVHYTTQRPQYNFS